MCTNAVWDSFSNCWKILRPFGSLREKNSKGTDRLRTTSPLSMEGKIFFTAPFPSGCQSSSLKRTGEAHLLGKDELHAIEGTLYWRKGETCGVPLHNFWDHHSNTVRKASQDPGDTLLLQPEGIRCNSQNLLWLWSLAYQYWKVWVAWSFQGLDIPACHSAQGFVQKALVGTVATRRSGLGYFSSFLICKTKGKDRHLLQEETLYI